MANGGGGGGGGSYTTIRELPEDKDIVILDCTVSVRLFAADDASYSFAYQLAATPECHEHSTFFFYVPSPPDAIAEFTASDLEGGLAFTREEVQFPGGNKTKFKITYRTPMVSGEKKSLNFSFRTRPLTLDTSSRLRAVLTYQDYVSFTVPCGRIRYELLPPPGYAFFETSKSYLLPIKDRGGNNPHPRPVVWEFNEVSPKSPIPISVAFVNRSPLNPAVLRSGSSWILGTVAAGFLGGAIAQGNPWLLGICVLLVLVAMVLFARIGRPR